jgi:pimeloyl-ACP methyl ester carboxylesterase
MRHPLALLPPTALAALLLAAPGATAAEAALDLAPCEIKASFGTQRRDAECGSWSVAEDPAKPSGKRIELKVAVVRARAKERDKAPDPVFFLAGGPGQSAIDGFMAAPQAFERILRKRDVVLLDQRGTGGSNRMQCPEDRELEGLDAYDRERTLAATRKCLAALPGDPALYTTSLAIDDLDAVRQALGYDRINLYGGSYGTRVALSYLKYHEASTRAVIIDAVVPQDMALGPAIAAESQRALDAAFARCAADAVCKASFPTLTDDFEALKARLRKGPVKVAMRDPVDGKPLETTLTYAEMSGAVRMLLYSPEAVAVLPLLLHQAAAGDLAPLTAQVLLTLRQTTEMLALGMHNSVVCVEDAPYYVDDAQGEALEAASYMGGIASRAIEDMCSIWPKGPIKDGFKQAVTSAKPVLLLSGEHDPITPPAYAERAARTLSNSRHLVAPGQGHTVLARGCLPKVAAEFLDALDPKGLDASCIKEMGDTPLFVRFTGPEP